MELVRGGSYFFQKVTRMINQAKRSIHIQVYIFNDDETGGPVAEALAGAARRGVDVYVMVDGYASRQLPKSFVNQLRDAGVHFRFFEPLFRTSHFYFGRRLHHKIIVTDAQYALVGGINISNDYNDLPGKQAWLDFALYAEGEVAGELQVLCQKTWNNFAARKTAGPVIEDYSTTYKTTKIPCRVALRRNDWVRRKNQVSSSYTRMLLNAQHEIIILCSYFLPGRVMRRHLAKAAARGVTVKIITAGRSDVPIVKQAERYLYHWLLQKNILIYEYQGILHGKMAVCDKHHLTVGSYNLNNLSTYASIELNLDVLNTVLAGNARSILNNIIRNDCTAITPEYHRNQSNWFRKVKRWVLFSLVQAALFLSTFYLRHTVAKQNS